MALEFGHLDLPNRAGRTRARTSTSATRANLTLWACGTALACELTFGILVLVPCTALVLHVHYRQLALVPCWANGALAVIVRASCHRLVLAREAKGMVSALPI